MKWDEPGAGISCCCAEVYVRHHDLEQVRGLLGHTRIETTQFCARNSSGRAQKRNEFGGPNGIRTRVSATITFSPAVSNGSSSRTPLNRDATKTRWKEFPLNTRRPVAGSNRGPATTCRQTGRLASDSRSPSNTTQVVAPRVELRKAWRDGTPQLFLEPLELLGPIGGARTGRRDFSRPSKRSDPRAT